MVHYYSIQLSTWSPSFDTCGDVNCRVHFKTPNKATYSYMHIDFYLQIQKYLKKLNLKISDNELQRWHPHFKLEEVPDIEEALLPQAAATKTVTSAKDMLGRSHSVPQVSLICF